MSENNESSNNGWKILFVVGYLSIFMGGLKFITTVKISLELQPFIAIISSILWFISLSIFQRIPDETGKIRLARNTALGAGIIQIAFAIWMAIRSTKKIDLWLEINNLFLAIFAITTLYGATLQYLFPKLRHVTTQHPPDPLAGYPQQLQEIIKKGRNWITGAIIGPMIFFFYAGVIGMLVTDNNDFFLIITVLGFMVGFPLGLVVSYKWQKWARQSGIPEEELKAAAKEVNLWWPNTKVE